MRHITPDTPVVIRDQWIRPLSQWVGPKIQEYWTSRDPNNKGQHKIVLRPYGGSGRDSEGRSMLANVQARVIRLRRLTPTGSIYFVEFVLADGREFMSKVFDCGNRTILTDHQRFLG